MCLNTLFRFHTWYDIIPGKKKNCLASPLAQLLDPVFSEVTFPEFCGWVAKKCTSAKRHGEWGCCSFVLYRLQNSVFEKKKWKILFPGSSCKLVIKEFKKKKKKGGKPCSRTQQRGHGVWTWNLPNCSSMP